MCVGVCAPKHSCVSVLIKLSFIFLSLIVSETPFNKCPLSQSWKLDFSTESIASDCELNGSESNAPHPPLAIDTSY